MHLGMDFNDPSKALKKKNQANTKPKSVLIKEDIPVCFMELQFVKIGTSINMAKNSKAHGKGPLTVL